VKPPLRGDDMCEWLHQALDDMDGARAEPDVGPLFPRDAELQLYVPITDFHGYDQEIPLYEASGAGEHVYAEVQNAGLEVQARINPVLARAAEAAGLPLVATGDVHYLTAADAYSHEALLCIQSGDSLKNPDHWRFDTNEFFFKSPAEMALDFPGHEDALRRTLEIAERCNVTLELGTVLLPKFPTPGGRDASQEEGGLAPAEL
jgi:DNA polymerase III subunit alpha